MGWSGSGLCFCRIVVILLFWIVIDWGWRWNGGVEMFLGEWIWWLYYYVGNGDVLYVGVGSGWY